MRGVTNSYLHFQKIIGLKKCLSLEAFFPHPFRIMSVCGLSERGRRNIQVEDAAKSRRLPRGLKRAVL